MKVLLKSADPKVLSSSQENLGRVGDAVDRTFIESQEEERGRKSALTYIYSAPNKHHTCIFPSYPYPK